MTCCSNSAKPGGGSGWRRSDVSSVADSRLGSSTGSEWGSAVGRRRLCLQIVILFLSNRRVISPAPPAGRVPCRSIIRITRHLAMPNFCGMRVVAFPTGMIGCKAVSKMGIAYVSSVHYRSHAAAAASIRRTEWNDGLLGSLFLSFRQRDPCGRGSESSLRGSDSCGSTMTIKRAMRT